VQFRFRKRKREHPFFCDGSTNDYTTASGKIAQASIGSELIRQANEEDTGVLSKKDIIDMVCTIAVYKFSTLSRDEVEAMLGLRLEETRVYQEASAEGEERGILKGEQALILRQLTRRIGKVAPTLQTQVQSLSLVQLESLGEALLDFSSPTDLLDWLQNH
jgi:predicted transposase YdaD